MFKKLGVLAGVLFLTVGFGYLVGYDLWADFRHRGESLEPARDVRVTEASCKSKLFVVTFCDVKLVTAAAPANPIAQAYFLFGRAGGERVAPLRSAADRTYLTTSFAQDRYWDRLFAFGVFEGFFVLGMIAWFWRWATGRLAEPG